MLLNVKDLSLSLPCCWKFSFSGILHTVDYLVTGICDVFAALFFIASGLLNTEDGGFRILRNTAYCVPCNIPENLNLKPLNYFCMSDLQRLLNCIIYAKSIFRTFDCKESSAYFRHIVSFYNGSTANSGPSHPHFRGFRITFRRTIPDGTPLDE